MGERRQEQKKLSGIIGIELPSGEFEPVQPKDKEQIQQRVHYAQAELQKQGYSQAATYVSAARQRLFSYIEFWVETGLAAARTTSFLERLMRELGRR